MIEGKSDRSWRGLSPDEIRRQFDMRVAVPNGQDFVASYLRRSEAARAKLKCVRELRYGPLPLQTLDVSIPRQANEFLRSSQRCVFVLRLVYANTRFNQSDRVNAGMNLRKYFATAISLGNTAGEPVNIGKSQ